MAEHMCLSSIAASRTRLDAATVALLDALPTMAFITDAQGATLYANQHYQDYTGWSAEALMGDGWASLIHPDDRASTSAAWIDALQQEVPVEVEYRLRRVDGTDRWFRGRAAPQRNETGRILNWLGTLTDIHDLKATEAAARLSEAMARNAEAEAREAEEWRRLAQEASGVGIFDWHPLTEDLRWSAECKAVFGFPPDAEITDELFLSRLHPEDRPLVTERIERALDPEGRGEYRSHHRALWPDGTVRWIEARGRVSFDQVENRRRAVHFIGTVLDITEIKSAEEALLRQRQELQILADAMPVLISYVDADRRYRFVNKVYETWFPRRREEIIGQPVREIVGEAAYAAVAHHIEAALRGERVSFEQLMPYTTTAPRHIEVEYIPRATPGGRVEGFYTLVQDVTGQKAAEAALRDESHVLETLNRVGAALAAELDLERLVQSLTDAGVELTGAKFGAYFHNALDESGERLHLYTLSGAQRSDFEGLGGVRATGVIAPIFRNEGVVRSEDILQDARYGMMEPHRGMPRGHLPVRSYLGVPVVSRSGEVLGGLLFGHPEPGCFSERHERLMVGLAAQAAIAIDNARLFQAVQNANEMLETRVAERTAELLQTQEALQQSQKMEAIGQLTGGVAHDFNNLLTPILGGLDIIRRRVTDERALRLIEGALQSAERASTLVQRLLAFARRQTLQPKPVDLAELVEGMRELIDGSLGPTIEVGIDTPADLPPILVDPNQLELALLNLSVNARDAMPDGGRLTIAAAALDASECPVPGLLPGLYVRLSVADTGIGMDEVTLKQAIEPFFSTKGLGKGTGLGLSMVHGLAAQSGGLFKLASQVGVGTTAVLWLPVADEPLQLEAKDEEPANSARRGVVLLVDDEELVRQSAAEGLEELGYEVVAVGSGDEALERVQAGLVPDAVVTDHLMPGMTGAQLAAELRERIPGLPILMITGYANLRPEQTRGLIVLPKPFRQADLAVRLTEMLSAAHMTREP